MDIFLFIAAILSMLATATIIHLVCRHTKQKALVTGITFQPIKQTEKKLKLKYAFIYHLFYLSIKGSLQL